MRFISLFSGCGGLDLGLAGAGYELALANEVNKAAYETLLYVPGANLGEWNAARDRLAPGKVVCGDVHDLLNSRRLRDYQGIDLIAGGPPCQGFSQAGLQDPEDERSQLVFRFMDAVDQVRPSAFLMENVPALASTRWRLVLDGLRATARRLGYQSWVLIANAQSYGVAQDRRRMFFIGLKATMKMPAPVLPAHELTVSALEQLTWLHGRDGRRPRGQDFAVPARITLAKNPVLRKSPYAGMLLNGAGRVIDLRRPAPTLPATMGGNRTPVIDLNQLLDGDVPWIEEYHASLVTNVPASRPFSEAVKRMRRLTFREAAALSGFPPFYPFQGSHAEQFRQAGNAVPPHLGCAVGEAVARSLRAATLKLW